MVIDNFVKNMLFPKKTSLSTIISFCYCVIDNSILSSTAKLSVQLILQQEVFIERKLIFKRAQYLKTFSREESYY
jgi:hypothetical protein